MEEKFLIESLSPIERNTLPHLTGDFSNLDEISEKSGQDKTTVFRATAFLKNKGLIEDKTSGKKRVVLGILGINYLKKQLPERALLDNLVEKKTIPIGEIKNVCDLNENEARVAVGILKKKAIIQIDGGRVNLVAKPGEIRNKMIEELFIEKLPLELDKLEAQDKLALQNLLSRKDIIEVEEQKTIEVRLTKLGEEIASKDLNINLIEQLTPKILKQSSWKGKKFRRYDLTSPSPRIYGGKRHFVNQAIDYGKSVWLEMGFKEMSGDLTTTGFWNFDTLFTAQDHPVREMQDTFFIKNLKGKLPLDKKLIEQVRKAHEGGIDGSKGWSYKWDEEESKRVLLRTHTTCLSTRTLKKIAENKEFPAKYFAMGTNFRNETVDWSHGFELLQTEGIVIDKNANFRHLLGYLKQFCKKMGYDKVRFRPAHFPYTEPSVEGDVWVEERKQWVELIAAGMFRPEVVVPLLGENIPVLAWGPGFGRMLMKFYEINDLRELYKNDINKLREMRFWMK
ncbi:MAG: phenylalanine--tRNA ligase subunit alpha [archaeon]|nr:phenylalanine--tRNA ligase subunit alpha [archaeon]MCR4323463.1 phenylalanine--tRNA ligase subunit alpha [Nanoarchaeota archaeon]